MPANQDTLPFVQRAPNLKLGFSGHETFAFRYGWLKKALDGVAQDSLLLSKDQAIIELGVGKNMVQSIRHWGLATGMLQDQNGKGLIASPIGQKLLGEWDPFLEEPASLWLIHWLLATNATRAATWYLAFTHYPKTDFSKRLLLDSILEFASKNEVRVKDSSLSRDIDCFVRTYVPSKHNEKSLVEDTFDCPLTELGLIYPLQDGESYQFAIGEKPSLPAEVVAYCLLQYLEKNRKDRPSIAVNECIYGSESPGQIFKLDENSMVAYLEEIQELTEGALELDDTIGLKQVYRRQELDAEDLLKSYFVGEEPA